MRNSRFFVISCNTPYVSGPVVIRLWCVVFDSCGRQFVRVASRWHRVARFPHRVFHSPRVISADVCLIVAFVPFDLFVDPCVPRTRVGSSYSLCCMLRYSCVRSALGMYRDICDAGLRLCRVVLSSWLFRCDMLPFVHLRSLRSCSSWESCVCFVRPAVGAVRGSFVSIASCVRRDR